MAATSLTRGRWEVGTPPFVQRTVSEGLGFVALETDLPNRAKQKTYDPNSMPAIGARLLRQ